MSTRSAGAMLVAVCLAGCHLAAWSRVSAAPILTVLERNSGRHDRIANDEDIVDINSQLVLRVSRDELRRRAGSLADSAGALAALIDDYVSLVRADSSGVQALQRLSRSLADWTTSARDRAAVERLTLAMASVADPTRDVIDALAGTRFMSRFSAALESALEARRLSAEEQYALFYLMLGQELVEMRGRLDRAAQTQGVYLQAGAWLRREDEDRPIHLGGFDRYPERDEYVVQRWLIAPGADIMKQVRTADGLAKALRSGTIGPWARDYARPAIDGILASAAQGAAAMDSALSGIRDRLDQQTADLREQLATTRAAALEYRGWIETVLERYRNPVVSDGETLLETTLADLAEFERRTTQLTEAMRKTRDLARQTADRFQPLRVVLAPLLATGAPAIDSWAAEIDTAAIRLRDRVKSVFGMTRQIDRKVEFGEEVFKLDIGQVPEETTVRLTRTGYRTPGDQFEIRIAMGSRSHERAEIARTSYELRRVRSHLDLVVGLSFAHADTSGQDRNVFQPAPSYSILLKGWFFGLNTRSPSYLRLWDPGIGLNLASLDFNHDDSQELGVGLVISTLRDFVQFGYGYNVAQGAPYSFFGLRLPLPFATLPSTRTEKSEP